MGALRLHCAEDTKPFIVLPFCLESLLVPQPSSGSESHFTDGETEAKGEWILVSSLEARSWASILPPYNRRKARPSLGCRGAPLPQSLFQLMSPPFPP